MKYRNCLVRVALLTLWLAGLLSAQAIPLQRVANTTLTNLPATPPTSTFTATNAFPGMIFNNPLGIYTPPGETNRLFILEKRGRIIVITNLAAPTRSIFMDITARVIGSDTSVGGEEGLLGLAFHPGYATNGYFFVYYTGNDNTGAGGTTRHDILSRFSRSLANTNQGDSTSEVKLIRQRDEASNHNGGELQFGLDGYLYVSIGDEGGGDAEINGVPSGNVQRITNDFFSAIWRLDVDKRPGSLAPNAHVASTTNYAVPPDNPFVGATTFNGFPINSNQVRTEFWAVGLRNPWRYSFDPATGDLYCADVGQSRLEEVNLIQKGKNYGWSYFEGYFQRTNPLPAGFVGTFPILQYGRTNGLAVVGGFVYRGSRVPNLYGGYIYGDYGSGRIWLLRQTNGVVAENILFLIDDQNNQSPSNAGISAFGMDPRSGYPLYSDEQNATDGVVKRIVPASSSGTPFPATLEQTGAFSDLATLTPQPGIVPYDLNLPFWSDNAIKSRWFSVPNTNLDITFAREGNWLFPTGTVWIKHFELELINGVPSSRKRLETRLLVKNSSTSGGYGITYRWTDPPTNALLVADEGMDEPFVVNDGGTLRTQVWHYPSRVECLQCHTLKAGFALGFNAPQLNREFDYTGTVTNQIAALNHAGYFTTNVTGIHTLRALAHPTNQLVSLEARARSYLTANCVQCHQGDSASAFWDARVTTRTADAGLVNGTLFNFGGSTNNRVLVPGSISNSVLLSRISTRGPGQMPPLASTLVDTQGIALVASWVTNALPSYRTFAQWQTNYPWANGADSVAQADPDGDGSINYVEYLTGTDPLSAASFWKIGAEQSGSGVGIQFEQIANRAFEVQAANSLIGPSSWTPLDVIGNEPFFSISNFTKAVVDSPADRTNRFYRVRVFEP